VSKIKVHEGFYSEDSSDEWQDKTVASTYYFDTKKEEWSVVTTVTYRNYRDKTSEAQPPETKSLKSVDVPKSIRKKLQDLGH
jgi:hypothetical protein